MTDIIEAGSDDEAIAGEHVGYVPCTDEAFPPDADDDSEAVDGSDAGYVADGTEAGDFTDSDDGQAVAGSAVGFVAKPCFECAGTGDPFSRVVADGWGTSPDGFVWTQTFPDSVVSVDGSVGVAVLDTVVAGSADSNLTIDDIIPLFSGEVISGTLDFWADNVATGSGNIAQIEFGGNAIFGVSMGTGSGRLHLQWHFTSVNQTKTDWVANTWYRMRYLYDKGSSLQAIKVWPRDDTEPGSWDFTRDPSADSGIGLNAVVLVSLARSAAAADPTTMKVDNLCFERG